MAKAKDKIKTMISTGTVAKNRRARFDYEIKDTFEVGIILMGSEVKSLRYGRANIQESYISIDNGELIMLNSYIAEYKGGGYFGHEERRKRKLLIHKKELFKIKKEVQASGMTIVPISLYFNSRGLAKLEIGLAKGRKNYDKREVKKTTDWNRDKARLLRNRG